MGYFDKKINRFNSGSYKYDKLKKIYPNINKDSIISTVADSDYRTSKDIIKSFKKLSKKGIFGYMTTDYDPFYDSIINYYKVRYNLTIDKEDIIYSSGAINSLEVIINLLTKEKDKIALSSPVYGHFYESINKLNREVVDIPLIRKEIDDNLFSYDFNFSLFEETLKNNDIKIYILCSPHNPIGKVYSEEELSKIIYLCQKYNSILVSDEVHGDIINSILNKRFIPIFKINNKNSLNLTPYKNIILLNGLGKTFNLAGIHASYILIKDKELNKFIKDNYDVDINTFALSAFISAYSDRGLYYIDKVNKYIDNNYNLMVNFIKENIPKLKLSYREGTYFVYLDFSALNITKEELNNLLMSKLNIYLEEGSIFSKDKDNSLCQRVCLSMSKKRIKELLTRLKQIF